METRDPTVTIKNTDSGEWLIRIETDLGNGERIDVTVLMPRNQIPLPDLCRTALERAHEHLQRMIQRP